MQNALNSLVVDIKKNYKRTFNFKDQSVTYTSKLGWDCIAGNSTCAGVNHQKSGKALYLNHSVYDKIKMAGIVALSYPSFTSQSALYHAGVKSAKDPRRKPYQNVYAYAISYNCNGLSYCQQIPAPTPENPEGLTPGAPFLLVSRSYVEPTTGERPSPDEIVHHQVLIGATR